MRYRFFFACLFACAAVVFAEPVQQGFRMDISAAGSVPFTWYDDGPTLPHLGIGGALGAEYDLDSWIPGRLELCYFGDGASAISSSGELYRAWHGLRIAAYGGYRFPAFALFHSEGPFFSSLRCSILAGGALTAAGYTSTNLAFAYPSLLAEARLDFCTASDKSVWLGLPFEYMFRGAFRTVSAGLVVGWRLGPLAPRPQRTPGGMK